MKALIVGYGSIGKRHFEVLSKNRAIDIIDVVSKYGDQKIAKYQELKDIPDEILSTYSLFIICSETSKHEEQLIYINQRVVGANILVEKPIANNTIKIEPQNRILVAYNLRFHPVIDKLKALVEGERILSFNAFVGQYLPTWRPNTDYKKCYSASLCKGGGVLRDLSHEIDYAMYLCGELSLVSAMSGKLSHLEIEADDVCTLLMKSNDSSAHIVLHMDYLAFRPKRTVEIQTDNLSISACLVSNSISTYDRTGVETVYDIGKIDRNYTYNELQKSIIEQKPVATTLLEANSIMKVIDEVTERYMEKSW